MGGATADKSRIVLVDRSGTLERRLKTALQDSGYGVRVVDTASACLRMVEQKKTEGVVSEFALDDVDGLSLLRSIRLSTPELPFILIPMEGSESIAGEAIAAGVSGYVPQTDGTETILARIEQEIPREITEQGTTGSTEESRKRYQQLVEMAPAPINIFDENGVSIWGNDAVVELLGLESRDELIGQSVFDFIHPDDHHIANREITKVIDEKDSVGPTSMKLVRPDGQVRHIQVATAVGSYLGADIGQAIIVDVTEREELYRQLKVLSTWLRHNIRNEMTVVHGIAGEVRRDAVKSIEESASKIQTHVEHLIEQADREREMVDLLVHPSNRISINISSMVEDQLQELRSEYPEAEIVYSQRGETERGRAAEIYVSATPQLPKAIGELLDNAIRHNDTETPTVSIALNQPTQGSIELRISDNGSGIPSAEKEVLHLEEPITQLNHGFGIGLLFAYCVVTQSGGSLRFSENSPRGTVITVTVPTLDPG